MGRTFEAVVHVDLDDIVSELTDEDIRELSATLSDTEDSKQSAIEAIALIRAGRSDDAVLELERTFLPKWSDAEEARQAYLDAMEGFY